MDVNQANLPYGISLTYGCHYFHVVLTSSEILMLATTAGLENDFVLNEEADAVIGMSLYDSICVDDRHVE